MLSLNYLRYAEIIGLLSDTETQRPRRNLELYFTACEFLVEICGVSGSPNYCRIISEELMRWETMSEAEKKLCEERIFTKQTVNGNCVYHDRFMEWIVKDIRSTTGKKL